MGLNSPSEIIRKAGELAIEKDNYSVRKILTLSFLAGAYIAFGGLLAIIVVGGSPKILADNPGIAKLLFGACFPVGIMMVVLAGAELFTGNNAYFLPNVLSGNQSWKAPLRNWSLVYLGNFIGALFVAYFLTHLTGIVKSEMYESFIVNIGMKKTEASFLAIFLKGIGANWLVCLALWMGMSSLQTSGKIFALWWPVMTFVALGYEHSIANMFFIPLAMFSGADISITSFALGNLLPATLGNIAGGAFFVGTLYWYAYVKEG